jgi:hypothetical protein
VPVLYLRDNDSPSRRRDAVDEANTDSRLPSVVLSLIMAYGRVRYVELDSQTLVLGMI